MSANSPPLGAELFELMFGQESGKAPDDDLCVTRPLMHVAVAQTASRRRKAFVASGDFMYLVTGQAAVRGLHEGPESSTNGRALLAHPRPQASISTKADICCATKLDIFTCY